MKKLCIEASTFVLTLIIFICLLSGCSSDLVKESQYELGTDDKFTKLSDFEGKKIASLTGTVFDKYLEGAFNNVQNLYYNDLGSQLEAVKSNKAAAASFDEPVAKLVVAQVPELEIFPEVVVPSNYGFATRKGDPIAQKASEVIEKFKKDGTMDEVSEKWFSADETGKILSILDYKDDFNGENGTLKFGHDIETVPMSYVGEGGKSLGFDVEIAMRIAYELNMQIELVPMNFGALIEAVTSGKVDMVGGCMSITEERKKSVDFTESYYSGGIVLVIKKDVIPKSESTFISGLITSFNRTFIVEDRWKLILEGFWVTILISILSLILGTALGALICLMRRSKSIFLNGIAKVYIRIIQGTPILVIIMILYYIIFRDVDISGILVAVIGFSLNFGAYTSEMFRTGIDTVDKGQLEAASAIGFNKIQSFIKITLPQAAKHVIPVFKGEFIAMVKTTSVVGYIAIQDLTKMSDIIRSRTYEAFFPLIVMAIIYFTVTYLFVLVLDATELAIDPKHRKRVVKGVNII